MGIQSFKSREVGIELFRILMMCAVCVYHALVNCGHNVIWLMHIMLVGVVGFTFISGWYGCRFSFRKIINLYGIAIYGGMVAVAIFRDEMTLKVFFSAVIDIFRNFWFLHAYVIMMMFSPLVEEVVKNNDRLAAVHKLMPVVALVFLWSFLGEIRYIRWLVPVSNGVTQLSGFTLVGIYCVARIARLYEQELCFSALKLFLISLGSAFVISLGHFGFYESPFMLVFAASLFFLFRKLNAVTGLGMVRFVAPSLFSVYVIHTNIPALTKMVALDKKWYSIMGEFVGDVGMAFVVGVIVFIVAFLLDLPRRVLSIVVRVGMQRLIMHDNE